MRCMPNKPDIAGNCFVRYVPRNIIQRDVPSPCVAVGIPEMETNKSRDARSTQRVTSIRPANIVSNVLYVGIIDSGGRFRIWKIYVEDKQIDIMCWTLSILATLVVEVCWQFLAGNLNPNSLLTNFLHISTLDAYWN